MMKLKKNETGFSAVEIILVLVIIVLLGVVGWFVYKNQKKTIPSPTTTANTTASTPAKTTTTTPTTPVTDPNAGYLVIKEWGVKIKMKDSTKVTYTYDGTPGTDPSGAGYYESNILFVVKPEYLQDKTCKVSVGYSRYKTLEVAFANTAIKIGDYYYLGGGSPYNCGNDADNTLNQSVRSDYGNIQAL